MRIKIIASGSQGNCTFVELNNTRFLIDPGVSCLTIEKSLKKNNISPQTIDYILLTHSHNDHVRGLMSFTKKYPASIYLGEKTLKKLDYIKTKYNLISKNFMLNEISINAFHTSHDIEESYGFLLEYQNESIVYLTDTGYVSEKIKKNIKNKQVYILESNHDVEMLMNTKRPHHLKMRILGDKGHLSNHDCASCLSEIVGINTERIILVHLSEEANTIEKATSLLNRFNYKMPIIVAKKEENELIEI